MLKGWLNSPSPVRLVVVGVGQVLRGDDGAGPAVVGYLRRLISPSPNLLLIDAGHAPENVLGPILRFAPTHVIFVDAVRWNSQPGTIRYLLPSDIEEIGGSTHSLSLGMLSEYIIGTTAAKVVLVGIQPGSMEFVEGLSPNVNKATEFLAGEIADHWRKATTACSAINPGGVSVVSN